MEWHGVSSAPAYITKDHAPTTLKFDFALGPRARIIFFGAASDSFKASNNRLSSSVSIVCK